MNTKKTKQKRCGVKKPKLRLSYYFFEWLVGRIYKKPEVLWRATTKPEEGEGVVYISNHTLIYAPAVVDMYFKDVHQWINGQFFSRKELYIHQKKMFKGKNVIIKSLFVCLIPLIVHIIKCMDGVPVYHDMRLISTFDIASDMLADGKNNVIYPETTDGMANKYLQILNRGFTLLGKNYHKKTGKELKFYPVYTAQTLKKVVVGDPIIYDSTRHDREYCDELCVALENAIADLADSLGEHQLVIYG